MRSSSAPLIAVALLLAAPIVSAAAHAQGPAPVVVELFTSQGCNSCPPADALLGELARRDDVLPLSFHITYWDRLGWPDTFGLEASTRRQQAYARWLGTHGLYTPQMVVGGRVDVVGSVRHRVLEAIDLLAAHPEPGPTLAIEDDRLVLGAAPSGPGTVWVIGFDEAHEVEIARGENRGRTIRYHHVVREMAHLGRWTGDAMEFPLPLAALEAHGRDTVAVLVQRESDGRILTAAEISLRGRP